MITPVLTWQADIWLTLLMLVRLFTRLASSKWLLMVLLSSVSGYLMLLLTKVSYNYTNSA